MDLYCPECRAVLTVHDSTAFCMTHGGQYQVLFLREAVSAGAPAGLHCAQHADVEAVAQCRVCGNGVCATCDFQLPGGMHVCPSCIESPGEQEISPKRKRRAWIAIALAALGTLMLVFAVTGVFQSMFGPGAVNDELVANLVGNLMLWPAMAGLAVAFTTLDRRLRNSAAIWTGVVWNGVLLGLFMVMMVIGLTMG